ncbi:von Willebrand factor D and EGF domain-containing protein [Patella vulgata]|uniref:von Willebrand factor D and EGF domain-containing protein n=1 Tax=Patella vulgata TaxID=6465 RepID=UPI0024A7AC33|nr:von Willebrand factor D and EGF domain-containing protein [Patella vulgata]
MMKMVASSITTTLLILALWVTVLHGVEVDVEITCNKPCLHGGECVLSPDLCSGFKQTCACPPSYTGEFCEKVILKVNCDKACENGGQCVVKVTENTCTTVNKTCVCPQNYHGDLCQTFVPTRASTASCDPPCTTGQGECVVLRNSQLAPHLTDRAYCNCTTAVTGYYYGNQCQHHQQKVPCDPPCKNGGVCTVTGRCNCQGTSRGDYDPGDCSMFSTDQCNPACENGGSCLGGVCQCKSTNEWDYSGSHCEQAVQCAPACVHGVCYSFGDNYSYCRCDSNSTGTYEGSTCDIFTAPQCTPACVHGVCIDGYCTCDSNSTGRYEGPACDIFTVSACSELCENGATCGVYNNECQCKSNATHDTSGPTCSQVSECVGGCLNGTYCYIYNLLECVGGCLNGTYWL